MFWLLDFPVQQYNENVVELASKSGLEIIDARFKDDIDESRVVAKKDEPKLTKKK